MIPHMNCSRLTTHSILQRIDPRMKLICTFSLLLTITASRQISALLPPAGFVLLLIALSRCPLRQLLRQLLIIIPFMITLGILFILSYHLQNEPLSISRFLAHPLGVSFQLILIKSMLALLLLRILTLSTPLNDLLWAMRRFRIPRIITTLSNLVYSYLHILTAETERIIRARNSRSVRKNRKSLQTLAQISASVFLRSFSRADQLYKAMLARGFAGEYPNIRSRKAGFRDVVALVFTLVAIAGAFWNR